MNKDPRAFEVWKQLFDDITPFLDKEKQTDKEYCFCHGVTGSLYQPSGIVAIGRAPNGWSCEWSLEKLRDQQLREEIVNDIVTSNVCKRDKQIKGDGTCDSMHWLEHLYRAEGGARSVAKFVCVQS
jgi:hypothetical protein